MNLKDKALNKLFLFRKKHSGYLTRLVSLARRNMPETVREKIKSSFLKPHYERLRRILISPKKTPRVFIKRGLSRSRFFDLLNERKVKYVLLRWWQDYPEIPVGEDLDILIPDEERSKLDDLVVFYDNGTGLKCDIYTIQGGNHGCRKNLPYFQSNLAHKLLDTRVMYRGIYVPAPVPYFASLAYHALFHKGKASGLEGFQQPDNELEHSYTEILRDLARELKLEVEISVKGIYSWLKEHNFAPAEDTLSKLAEIKPELDFLQTSLSSDVRGGDLIVYIIRERLLEEGHLKPFTDFLKKEFLFDIIDVRMLEEQEILICSRQIRGGKWDKGPFKYSGGPPAAFVVAYDYHPWPLSDAEAKKQTRMTNRNNPNAKYAFREKINQTRINRNYNGIHSADNEHDARFYISLLGKKYAEFISDQVEQRRSGFISPIGTPLTHKEYNGTLEIKKDFQIIQGKTA
ncbi:hypothetical protein KIH41_13530 [Litoribacter ruber]|uniref:hypothetical protein n=1 Tax=Litoribacter ruber TaxID=702568 RepID=UPI001BD98689|nr:hypothetical protein [Litoribacter ruber]MBT0812301.1 hypothetical protein [Litoribacter ruber]